MSGRVKGDISKASVEIGGLKLENIYLGIALDIDIPILEDVIWDGIVGLSFQNRKLKQQNIPTLFDQIMVSKSLSGSGN